MSKRFTDTEKWNRPWFRELPSAYRFLWLYILDNCNNAGIWYVDMKLASFMIGEPLDYDMAKEILGKQIIAFDSDSKWFIEDFVTFQYGTFSNISKPHLSVLGILKKHGLDTLWIGYPKGMDTLKDKDKDMCVVSSVKKEETIDNQIKQPEPETDEPTPEDLMNLWNETAHKNLPRVQILTEPRKRKCKSRLTEHPDEQFWIDLMTKINRSPLLTGLAGSWKCTFDWILEPSNMTKIIEGNYEPDKRR